jgi:hypothetical protein
MSFNLPGNASENRNRLHQSIRALGQSANPLKSGTDFGSLSRQSRSMGRSSNLSQSIARSSAGDPNGTFSLATDLGRNPRTTRTGSIGFANSFWDQNDYYKFSVTRSSSANITLSGLTQDADLQLYSNSRQLLGSSTGTSSTEAISRRLSPGTYFVRVYPFGQAETSYRLTLST